MTRPFPLGISDGPFDRDREYTLDAETRTRPTALFGKTGVGKSSLLYNLILWEIYQGNGATILDPHGSLVSDLLDAIPKHRTNDVIFINPKDRTHSIGVNILERPRDPHQEALTVSYLISIFKKIWGESSWGPRLEQVLSACAFALIEQPAAVSLLAIPKLLNDEKYRAMILTRVSNPVVKTFFRTYEQWDNRFRQEAISPVLNKIHAFSVNPLLRSILGQTRSSFDFRWGIDQKKIILCDLSKGALGEEVSSLLGSLILTKVFLAALSRENVPESARTLHGAYIDECHSFGYGVDIPSLLSESRKYKLSVTLADQSLEQLPERSAIAVLSNCATIMSYRVSGRDAETLKHEFAMIGPGSQLQDLEDYKLHIRTVLQGKPRSPRVVKAFPPFGKTGQEAPRDQIIRVSRQRYGRRRNRIEARLTRFLNR